ncbi:uncharacterized protein [Bemisia tabaci]|uniref:uncharacterized protein n=1 Tax=Bemisia tabaci TaxID=7038 RepID=UPI003B284743
MAVIEVEPFVLMVRENDLLYNKNRTDYKDHEKKMECWQNIARFYGVPVTVVLAKWKSLREKYIKERKQVRLHGPGALKWEHHNLFKFLDPYIFPRNRQKRCVRARPMEVSVPPSAILDDSSSQGLYIDEGDHDPRSGEVSGNSSTVEDSGLHYSISTSIHPASTSVLPASTSVLPASSSRSLGTTRTSRGNSSPPRPKTPRARGGIRPTPRRSTRATRSPTSSACSRPKSRGSGTRARCSTRTSSSAARSSRS